MCRMIAGAGVVSVDYLVDGLRMMAGVKHKDGWGLAYRLDGHLFFDKSTSSCLNDSSLNNYSGLTPDLAVFHARRSKAGSNPMFTHPFLLGCSFLLFHNASFRNGEFDPLRLADYLKAYLSDDDVEASFAEGMRKLQDFRGANCVLVGLDKMLVGVRHRKPGYYQMHYSADNKGVVVSSEPLPGREWAPLADGSVLALYPDGRHKFLK